MSDYLHQKGYIYPLGKLSDEENNSIYKKIKGEENFELDKDKFELEYMGENDYLIWLTYSTYGEKSDEFGSCRHCNQQEIYYHAPKFRDILGEIDTKKLKFIDYCYYNSTECNVDYYLGEEEYKPMTLEQAIAHAKEVADSKYDECGKEHAQLAEWLQDLASFKDKTYISEQFLMRNGFEKREYDYLYCNNVVEVSAQCTDTEAGTWHVYVNWLDSYSPQSLDIYTLGELRMFLAIEGLDNIVEQLK